MTENCKQIMAKKPGICDILLFIIGVRAAWAKKHGKKGKEKKMEESK